MNCSKCTPPPLLPFPSLLTLSLSYSPIKQHFIYLVLNVMMCIFKFLIFSEVTSVLLFGAQATHDLVPPEIIQNLLKTIVNNFVTERNSNEVMAIG